MREKLWILAGLSALFFSGCAQTAPDLGGSTEVAPSDTMYSDTVSIDEGTYDNMTGTGVSSTGFNSSGDGFLSIYFGFDNYTVNSKMQENMRTNIAVAQKATGIIKIEGNCDEFGTDEYNYALGLKRAKAVKDNLITQGIVASKMMLVSFGESTPACQSATDSCYEQNRRVDLRMIR
jgi:peptidoglycan-associated lipoprotein